MTFFIIKLQKFLLSSDLEAEQAEQTEEIRMKLTSLHDNSTVIIWFHDKDKVKILTENMDLAGDMIQSLANFLNIEHLMVNDKNHLI